MILTDTDIKSAMRGGYITITPFDVKRLGPNSYDLTLGKDLLIYTDRELDCAREPESLRFEIPETGYVLQPGELYLGTTVESTGTKKYVPLIEGKSSVGRLGIDVHKTAGFGDIGFEGHWTLEIEVVKPIRVYAGMPIAQVYFIVPLGLCETPYNRKADSKYHKQPGIPMPSQMYKNFTGTLS